MKRLIFATSILAIASASFAQSFSEGWENGPAGFGDATVITWGNSGATNMAFGSGTWVALNNSTTSAGAPAVGTTGWFNTSAAVTPVFASQAGAAQLNGNFNATTGANNIDLLMMSPVRLFKNGDTISFFTRTVDSPAFPDRLNLKFSSNGASTLATDFTTTLLTVNSGLTTTGYPNTWTQFSVTLSGLASGGVNGRFAFDYNVTNGGPSGSNSDFIGIDTVQYTAVTVPEPASMAALGLGALALIRRRRAAKK